MEAPSPKKATETFFRFCILMARPPPVAMGMPPPTMALAPRLPLEKSAMCIEPLRPLQ